MTTTTTSTTNPNNTTTGATTATPKKKAKKKTPPGPINLTIAAPPTTPSPTPPVGADLTSPLPHGLALVGTIAGLASSVSAELRAATSFTQDFGGKIPPLLLANALDAAAGWQQARLGAEHWYGYVLRADAAAWKPVLDAVAALRRIYAQAVVLDPQLPTHYPQLAALFAAKGAPGARSAKTRAADAKAKAKAKAGAVGQGATATTATAAVAAATGAPVQKTP